MDNPDVDEDEKSYFRVGAALDCLLTSPERWDYDFTVVEVNRPYGLMGKFIDELPSGLTPESDLSLYQEAYDKAGYKMWLDKVVDKFWESEELVKYYKLTRDLGDGVIVLSADEYDSVIKSKELILSNKYVKSYFLNDDPGLELMHQVPIYFEFNVDGIHIKKCKALLDGIKIDHINRTIRPFDLKTTRSVYDFPQSFLQYGYYRQAAFYLKAIVSEESPVLEYIKSGYEILPFIFIAVENKKSSSHPAIIYETSDNDIKCGMLGGTVNGKKYLGILQLMENLIYHEETNYWDLPVELIKNNGKLYLDVFD